MTKRRAAVRPLLSDLEHDVMHAVWQAGEATVEAVHAIVAKRRDLKEVTTRTILRRLEHKGYLRHEVSGRAYIYRAVEEPRSLAARAVRQLIDRFCLGSVDELVMGLVEADVLSEAELAALERSIRAHSAGPAAFAKATAARRSFSGGWHKVRPTLAARTPPDPTSPGIRRRSRRSARKGD